MGANLAPEVADEKFCETTIGAASQADGLLLRDIIQTDYFRVVVVNDVEAVEMCGALKVCFTLDFSSVRNTNMQHTNDQLEYRRLWSWIRRRIGLWRQYESSRYPLGIDGDDQVRRSLLSWIQAVHFLRKLRSSRFDHHLLWWAQPPSL